MWALSRRLSGMFLPTSNLRFHLHIISNHAYTDTSYFLLHRHTEGAAGLASLIGSALAMQHGTIPPNLHFQNLSARVAPFYTHLKIPTQATPWPATLPGQPRRVSVNSFGKFKPSRIIRYQRRGRSINNKTQNKKKDIKSKRQDMSCRWLIYLLHGRIWRNQCTRHSRVLRTRSNEE
jgi:hypothetical protein